MKNIIKALCCAALMLVILSSCNSGKDKASSSSASASDSAAQTSAAQTTQPVSTEIKTVVDVPKQTQPEIDDKRSDPGDPNDATGFVSVTDVVPDAMLDIRYYSTYNFVGDRINGYEQPMALISKEAANALKAASDKLREQGYRIKIYDAYRPQSAVDHFASWAKDLSDTRMKKYFYPELDKSVLFDQGYIAYNSGHSRGCTVDLTLFDMDAGKDLDMGGTFDYFGERSHTDYSGITEEQKANRNILRDAMTSSGFESIATEWWHFSLTDEPYPDTYFNFPVSLEYLKSE